MRFVVRSVILVLSVLGCVVLALWVLPALLTLHPRAGLSSAEILKARNDVRGVLIQSIGAAGLVGGLFYTARTYRLSVSAQEITRIGQVTDRYSDCVEQLGRDILTVRLGAIYALERLLRDSDEDRPTIIDVLCAFLRQPSVLSQDKARQDIDAQGKPNSAFDAAVQGGKPIAPTDVQAAITVVTRSGEDAILDLQRAPLTGISCPGVSLRKAKLEEADLIHSRLAGANLQGANMWGAKLDHVGLDSANLEGAYLARSRMWHASFGNANLKGALLTFVDARNALFLGADLEGSSFRESDLRGARFRMESGIEYLSDAKIVDTDFTGAKLIRGALSEEQLDHAKGAGKIVWCESETAA
jgi:uncharacterized protein YjbI with pentapeptide repeats